MSRRRRCPTTSSVFSFAKDGEDWTKISDLQERKRIQKILAGRKYRFEAKKRVENLKNHVESLERRVGSPSAPPPQRPAKIRQSKCSDKKSKKSNSKLPPPRQNEDWTKISDLAERRRIQNRISQRDSRKKHKKFVEDLKRRAGSSIASPPQTPAKIRKSKCSDKNKKSNSKLTPPRQNKNRTKISDRAERRRARNCTAQNDYCKGHLAGSPQKPAETPQLTHSDESSQQIMRSSETLGHCQFTPPMHNEDEGIFANVFERDGSRTPPLFTYHTSPTPEDVMYPPPRPISLQGRDVTLPLMPEFHDPAKPYQDSPMPFTPYPNIYDEVTI